MNRIKFSFHTPVLPSPLNLDLFNLTGGGSCPSQFYGVTKDQRDLYVRYRGGRLTADLADTEGQPATEGTRILQTDIGPDLDGSITVSQFCEFFGVTVNGVIPRETNPERDRFTDFSGKTTYWNGHLGGITAHTARKVLAAAQATMPDALLVQPVLDESHRLSHLQQIAPDHCNSFVVWLVGGARSLHEIATCPANYVLPSENQLHLQFSYPTWHWPKAHFSNPSLAAIQNETGTPVYQVGIARQNDVEELATNALQISTSFPCHDHATRHLLAELEAKVKTLFPETSIETVDIISGEPIAQEIAFLDPEITRWCANGPNRWLSVGRENHDGPWTGHRPKLT